jgi:hypothetical protein
MIGLQARVGCSASPCYGSLIQHTRHLSRALKRFGNGYLVY